MGRWITQTQACEAYRVGPQTLERYSRRGLLPFVRTDEAVRYDRQFVDRMFRRRDTENSDGLAAGWVLGETVLGEQRDLPSVQSNLAA